MDTSTLSVQGCHTSGVGCTKRDFVVLLYYVRVGIPNQEQTLFCSCFYIFWAAFQGFLRATGLVELRLMPLLEATIHGITALWLSGDGITTQGCLLFKILVLIVYLNGGNAARIMKGPCMYLVLCYYNNAGAGFE
jgi:hypothetical protein